MKKIITLLLAISVAATMLVGCGKKEESETVDNKASVEQKDVDNKDKAKDEVKDKKDESNSVEEQKVENKDPSNENQKSSEVKNVDSQGSENNSKQVNSNKNDSTTNNDSNNSSTQSKPEQSNPTPEPTPEPTAKYVTISITCNTLLNNMDKVDAGKKDIVPSNGVILGERTVEIKDGETVFDVLKKQTRENRIHMDFMESPVYQSVYVKGIANLYEFDGGPLSGWMYSVNGVFPNYGCSKYELKNGDKIEWKYTCDLGADLGHGM